MSASCVNGSRVSLVFGCRKVLIVYDKRASAKPKRIIVKMSRAACDTCIIGLFGCYRGLHECFFVTPFFPCWAKVVKIKKVYDDEGK